MWVKVARFILKYRVAIIVFLTISTAFMGYEAKNVHLSYEYASLLPQTDSAYIQFVHFKEDFGSDANGLIVGLKTKDIFNLQKFNRFVDMCDTLHSIEGVDNIMSVAHAVRINESGTKVEPYFTSKPETQEELDSISALILNQPLYEGLLFDKDKDVYVLMLTIRQSILDSPAREELIAHIETILREFESETEIPIFITGMPYVRTQTSLKLQSELSSFAVWAVIVCAIILYIIFRSVKNVLFSLLVVVVSVVWVLGWMGVFDYELTMLSAMLSSLIIVICVPNCVFFLNKYHQEYAAHGNKIKALQRVIYKVGNSLFLSNLTTAVGFLAFLVTDSTIMQEFGLVASLGILGIFVFSITILTIIFSYLAPPSEKMLKHLDSKFFDKAVDFITRWTSTKRPIIYVTTIVMLAVAIWGMTKIQRTGYVVDDLPQKDAIMRDLRFAEEKFNGVLPLEIQIEDTAKINIMRDKAFQRKVDELVDSLATYSELAKPLSIIDFLKFSWQAHNGGNPEYYKLPNSTDIFYQNKLKKLAKGAGNGLGNLQYSLVDSTGKKIRVRCSVKDVGTDKIAVLEKDLYEDLNAIFPSDRYKTLITGTSIMNFKGSQYLLKNLFSSVALAIVIVGLFMAILFRSKRMVLVSLIPNILPMFFTAALMGFFGIRIKVSTILVFSIAFGISIDDTIHFLSRYRQGLKSSGWSIKDAVNSAIRETSPSMISTSVILFFGFGIFIFSQFGGTMAMGSLVAMTLLFAMIFNNLLLPSLLLTLDKRITTRHFEEPLLDIYNEEEDIEIEDLEIE